MKHRMMLALALALATMLPAAAQYGSSGTMPSAAPSAAATTMPSFTEGAFVGHRAATAHLPETVTLRFDWQGTPVLGTYVIQSGQRWMSAGTQINWGQISEGASVTVPSSARLVDLTFGGNVGVGTITAHDHMQQVITVRLPSGETRMIRHAAAPLFVRSGQVVPLSQIAVGQTVMFEIPPEGNQVAILTEVGPGVQATVTSVSDQGVTVSLMEGGQQVTRTYPLGRDTDFFSQGRLVMAEDVQSAFQANQPVWIFGPPANPTMIVTGPTMGFESAIVTTTTPDVAVTTPETGVTTTTVEAMAAPFGQGTLVAYNAATANMPATATFRFDWNGTPLLGTFIVSDQDRWISQGQMVDLSQAQAGATITVPSGARLANLTFGGRVGVATINSINRTNNTITVRLPNGQTRVLRVSPQAVFVQDGMPMTVAQLNAGDTVMFEVVPNANMVGVITPIQPGIRGTITQVSDNSITVRYVQNGQTLTRTIPLSDQTRFYSSGQQVTVFSTAYRVGEPVWIYGPVEQPQFVATGVQSGFETAVVTQPPVTAVGGVRQQPPAPRRVIRGRW